MMECDVIRDLMPLYADGQISAAGSRLVDEHVTQCPECRRQLEQMQLPMEQEPGDEEQGYLTAIRAQKRKTRRRIIFACILTALVCVTGWWLDKEYRFRGETPEVVSTDGEQILEEMPRLALTQAEKDLAEDILKFPIVLEIRNSVEVVEEIPLEEIGTLIAGILPEDAGETNVSVTANDVCIGYRSGGLSFILEYIDADGDDKVTLIRKTVGVPKSEEDWAAKEIYVLEYVVPLDRTGYEKSVSRHVWFGFLDMP